MKRILLLISLLQGSVMGGPFIGEVKDAVLKETPKNWGTKFQGDKGMYPSDIYDPPRKAEEVKYDKHVPPYLSPNDPGLDAWGDLFLGHDEKFMKKFGYIWGEWDPSKDSLSEKEVRLLRWVEGEGLSSPCAAIAHFPDPNFQNRTLTGLAANCTNRANGDVMEIPTKLIITPHRLANSPMYDRIHSALKFERSLSFDLDHILLTLFLVLESQDTSSYWSPYLNLLPEEVGVPSETDEYGQLWLDASQAAKATEQRGKVVEWQFEHLVEFFETHPNLLPKYRHFNKNNFAWAYNVVTARSFRLDFGVHRDALCLVPFADLMNHQNVDVGWLFRGKSSLSFYTATGVEFGQQIFNNYGALGNEALAMDFGFVMEDNPNTCAYVQLPAPPPEDQHRDRRLTLLKAQQLDFDTPICVKMGAPTKEMLFVSLILTAEGDDITQATISPTSMGDFLNENSVTRLSQFLVDALTEKVKSYTYPKSQDERLLPLLRSSANSQLTDNVSLRRFNAVFLRREEKIILESAIQFLNISLGYKCRTLPQGYIGADDSLFEARMIKTCVSYAKKAILPLLQDIAWSAGSKYVRPKKHLGDAETWDYKPDLSVFPTDGQPHPICNSPDCKPNK